MCVLDDVCATMHAVSDGADMKFVEVITSIITLKVSDYARLYRAS